MCVSNVNATVTLFSDIKNVESQGLQDFSRPFDFIISNQYEGNIRTIGGFYIVVDITLLGTTNEERKKTNIICNKQKLNVLLRLTKSSSHSDKIMFLDIDEFTIDASDASIIKKNACVPYINYRKIKKIENNGIQINPDAGLGDYVFKVLVKRPCDEEWQPQSFYNLRIE